MEKSLSSDFETQFQIHIKHGPSPIGKRKKEVCVCVRKREKNQKREREREGERERERERESAFLIMKREEVHGFDHADDE